MELTDEDRALLADELGVEPGEGLRRLHAELLAVGAGGAGPPAPRPQPHADSAKMRKSVVVMRNVPVTARPYAVARRSEERKVTRSSITATKSSQFTDGT